MSAAPCPVTSSASTHNSPGDTPHLSDQYVESRPRSTAARSVHRCGFELRQWRRGSWPHEQAGPDGVSRTAEQVPSETYGQVERPDDGRLTMSTLAYADELVPAADVEELAARLRVPVPKTDGGVRAVFSPSG
jgi:hypothetical protein